MDETDVAETGAETETAEVSETDHVMAAIRARLDAAETALVSVSERVSILETPPTLAAETVVEAAAEELPQPGTIETETRETSIGNDGADTIETVVVKRRFRRI